jgi:thiamine biosynthesis lipoprotein
MENQVGKPGTGKRGRSRTVAAVAAAAAAPAGALAIETREPGFTAACFTAMASPCEVLIESESQDEARELGRLAAEECWRIEHKFSRYRDDSVVAAIHRAAGRPVRVDAETALLIDFAAECHALSDGLFDVTSGVLRRVWRFDGSSRVPTTGEVEALLPLIGFHHVRWNAPTLELPSGMEIDFGGIGKEYAVDRVYDLIAARYRRPFLVNFGGDLRANAPPSNGSWRVGIESPEHERVAAMLLELGFGALATSGDTRRFLLRDGVRYGHILDPRTGWPVQGAPRSVTVAASSCTEAGLLSTLALLKGPQARSFLEGEGVRHWILS